MYLQMNKTIKLSFAKRIGFTFMMMLLTTATAWAGDVTVTSETTAWTDGNTYNVTSDVTIDTRISVSGTVTLNLGAGATLTASKGIEVSSGNTLTIEGSGTLNATGAEIYHSNWTKKYRSGIGADAVGTIIINSGTVNATGAAWAAGIGGDSCNSSGGSITINGGIVNATGNGGGAGIGGGLYGAAAGTIVINGGQVTATAAATGAGIGSGQNGATGGTLTLGWTDVHNDFIEAKRGSNSARPFDGLSSISFADGKLFVLDGTATQATLENINQVGTDVKLVPTKEIVDLSNATVSGVSSHYAYTGSNIAITPVVTLLGETLTATADYTISYTKDGAAATDVNEAGTYTLTIAGTDFYTGSISTTFYVNAPVDYQAYENGALADRNLSYNGYARINSTTTAMSEGWYVVADDVTISDRISVSGDVHLVLCDNVTLTAEKGISVTDGNSLTIYSQIGNTGKLVATGWNEQISDSDSRRCAGIGGDMWGLNETAKAGSIIIHGGEITAIGGKAAGIGRAYGGAAGNITIYGGKIAASSGDDGTGIGGGGANIHLGWCRSNADYIEASGYEGSMTFDKVFVLDSDKNVTATASNSGGQKIIPTTSTIHTVEFQTNGGSSVISQKIVEGQTATEPVKPIKQGYKLVNWYTTESLSGDAYNFSSPVNSDLTLYAKWETVDAISYIGADGQTVSSFTNYTTMESGYVSLSEGTYFVSENTTVSSRIAINGTVNLILGDGATLTISRGINVPNGTILNIFCQSAGTGTLTANAAANNAGIGGNHGQNSGTVRIYGGVVTSTGGNGAAGIGGGNRGSNGAIYIYDGTVTSNGGNHAAAIGAGQLRDGGIISILGGKVTANANSAYFTGIGYFDDENNQTVQTATITLGYKAADGFIQATNYLGTVTVEAGKMFINNDATPVDISGSVTDLSTINGKTLTPKTYTVSFSLGYDGGTAPVAQTVYHGLTKATEPTPAPTRTGYDLGGWKNGGAAYDFTAAVTSDLTLTAAWTPIEYAITYYGVDGATFATANPTTYTIEDAITLNNPSKTGYTFTGWTGSNGDTPQTSVSIATGSHEDKTYTANWKKLLTNADIAISDIPAQQYNGTALTPALTVSDGATPLVKGTDYTVSPETAIDAGTYTLTLTGIGAYDGTATRQFTVSRRAVTLTSATDEKTYDGTALTADGVTEGGDGFAQGEGATYSVTGTQTNAGSSANTFTYTLNDGTKAANYDITIANGTLTINPASVTLTANSDTKEYSGAEQTVEGFTSSVDGLTFTSVTASGSGTDTGTYYVTFTGVTINTTKDDTGNYVVTSTTDGTLTITAKTVTNNNALTVTQDENGYYATFTGSANDEVSIPDAITVKSVTLNRDFSNGKYATLMLPFSLNANEQTGQTLTGANIYQFVGVTKVNGQWIATMQTPTSPLQANTPYLVEPVTSYLTDGKLTFGLNGGTVTLQTEASNEGSTNTDWQFIGTYTRLTYGTGSFSGYAYGFASKDKTVDGVDVKAGEFVYAKEGAAVPPLRCFLTYKNGQQYAGARAMTRGMATEEDLPQSITVRLIGTNGETTNIVTMDSRTGEITTEGWWTLDGMKLSGKPAKKGLYIHNGRKEVLK